MNGSVAKFIQKITMRIKHVQYSHISAYSATSFKYFSLQNTVLIQEVSAQLSTPLQLGWTIFSHNI
jgi:hypothetical protein